jgi:hypothetical protein
VIEQAAGLALLSALSPTALLVAAAYIGSARPRQTGLFYLAGALTMSLIMGVVFLVVLRAAGLSLPGHRTPRYGLRLGLGLLLVAAGLVLAVRKPKQPDPAQARRGIVSRMIASPAPVTAYLVGVIVFAPSITFLAAVQVVATAKASLAVTVAAVAVIVVIDVLLVWLPLVLYLISPGPTTRHLTSFNRWLRAHGTTLLVGVLVVVGAIMVIDGSYGLIAGK